MLESSKLILRPLEIKDVDTLYLWENDRANWHVSHTISPYSKHVLTDYVQSVTDIYSDKQLRLIIEEKATGKAMGTLDLFDCDFKNKKTGIGILIAESAERGKGVATEALKIVLEYCYKVLALNQVYCNILEENAESLHLFEKSGFVKIGLKKGWVFSDGTFHNEWLLQKLNPNEKGE